MYAYELATQESQMLKRRNSEKKSFNKLRDELEAEKDKLTSSVNSFKNDIDNWQETKKSEWENWHNTNDKTLKDWSALADNKNQSDSAERRDSFISFMNGCKIRIQELENTYQEKLRLEKPAEYWKKAARKYGLQGGLWSLALLSMGILGIIYFRDFFNIWLKSKELDIQLNSLQGIAIYGSILAVYAFLIRILSRLTFSSFHLMRDAEEREQLTYVYLSLSKEQNVNEASRAIILQSLFSRTETGLLNNESGPTMPGLHEIVKSGTTK
jgi:hypothetical protein